MVLDADVARAAVRGFNSDPLVQRQEQTVFGGLADGFAPSDLFGQLRSLNIAYSTRSSNSDLQQIASAIGAAWSRWCDLLGTVSDIEANVPSLETTRELLTFFLDQETQQKPRSLATKALHFAAPRTYVPADTYAADTLGVELGAGRWAHTDGLDVDGMAQWYTDYLIVIRRIGEANRSLIAELYNIDDETIHDHRYRRVRGLPKMLDKIIWWCGREKQLGQVVGLPMSTWVDEYYDIVEDYFWEPQLIGRKSVPGDGSISGWNAHLSRLKRLEVPLNHLVSIFFRLAPDGLICRMLSLAFDRDLVDRFDVVGNEVQELLSLRNFMQADVFLSGRNSIVSIELKVDAISGLEQVVKYALIGAAANQTAETARPHFLLYMGPRGFADLWDDRYADSAAVLDAARDYPYPSKKLPQMFASASGIVESAIEQTSLGYLSYHRFWEFLENQRSNIDRSEACSETIVKLLDGMASELHVRGY